MSDQPEHQRADTPTTQPQSVAAPRPHPQDALPRRNPGAAL